MGTKSHVVKVLLGTKVRSRVFCLSDVRLLFVLLFLFSPHPPFCFHVEQARNSSSLAGAGLPLWLIFSFLLRL